MRKLLLTTALVALGLGVATMPVQAQEMRIALSTFEKGLDPQDNTGNSGAPMLYQIYDTLIERDSFSTPLSFKPGLATEWTQIEPTVWELKLREGVVFHNGDTFDADDVEFSLDRMYHHEDPEFFSAWGRWHYNFKDAEVIDPYTIRIHTLRPEPAFLTLISSRSAGITSKDYQEEVGFDGGDWVTTGVPDGAQSFLASAVAAAADSRPFPPLHPSRQQSSNPSQSSAMLGSVETAVSFPLNGPPLNSDDMFLADDDLSSGSGVSGPRPPGGGGNTVLIHYEGHKSRYDEWIAVGSPRLAPYRSRTSRPLSVNMQSVQKLVKGMSVR